MEFCNFVSTEQSEANANFETLLTASKNSDSAPTGGSRETMEKITVNENGITTDRCEAETPEGLLGM